MSIAPIDEAARMKAMQEVMRANRIMWFTKGWTPEYPWSCNANPQQQKLLDAWENPKYRIFMLPWGNRSGKTEIEPIIGFSVMMGEWPWSGKKLWFPHKKPRKVMVVGQGWESHVEEVVMPKFKAWWPKSRRVKMTKNNQGVDASWVDTNSGSTLEVRSTVQKKDTFEGGDHDLIIFDEPPPREIWVACSRGLIDRSGRALFGATLIKEAWVHRDIILRTEEDGTPDMSVFMCKATMYDNVSRCDECGEMILRIEQDGELGEVGICPKHGKKRYYIKYGLTLESVKQYIKDLRPDEIKARIDGEAAYLTSLVCPDFKRQTHVRERFKIPLDWLVDISIDFHPSKKWAVVFLATAKNGFKYVCDEIWDKGNPKYIAEEIIRLINERSYTRINSISIDPLAKGGTDNDIDVYSIIAETLASRNYSLETASKDKDVGISILNNLIWTENEMPGLFYFRDCKKTIEETENWMYDPETLKPAKVDDDFVECLYRLCLKNTIWYEPWKPDASKGRSVML